MKLVNKISDLKIIIKSNKSMGKTIGFVPTMGYLHEGHLSLARRSVQENDFTVMSIFVNPTQFGPNEDFERYPRDLERDLAMAESVGVDVVFAPSVEEMYPDGYKTYVNVEDITGVLCGRSRPGHFRGVTTVVNKLFNIVEPDKAYFGQKDAQQVVVVKKMVRDLNMNLEVVACPIVREPDGLAMSSRNTYLSSEERKAALILSKSLFEAEELIKQGERSGKKIAEYIEGRIKTEKLAEIDYVEVVSADSLEKLEELKGNVLIALAVKFGKTRLIDNVIVEV
ncbi:pantoate--beta-alanine ligase [Acetivibrio clariflavus]|uniref:Pantothenate synthetase n=1 Tax=Acetivibrio clariflavus (strain DSM 19732 / NBRC 101661 / EBR45) TaxID=720554 RepID=G8LWQ1_ACECE|nr:pantoate--beta-alanine ligase [Acetivibrio clariflavus]AEV68719.1 pantoate--beta-alanine ligase [Acetivibrio clariflavus DSM 19732]